MGSSGGLSSSIGVTTLPADHNYLGWSNPVNQCTAQSALSASGAAGTLVLLRVRRLPAASVTNVVTFIQTAGSGLTAGQCFGALYSASGTLIGQTADQSTAWASTGVKTMALASGPFNVAAGDYYVGLWYNGTTAPSPIRGGTGFSGAQMNVGQSSGQFDLCTADAGLTTLAPPTLGAQTSANVPFWVALS
jgi:hypothetical protein